MSVRLYCQSERRRDAVRGRNDLNGIDFLEVSEDQLTLTVEFLNPLPGQPNGVPAAPVLTRDNVRIVGGVRVTAIAVTNVAAADRTLTVTVSAPGDFSDYVLQLASSPVDDAPPAGFDPQLSAITFNFKVGCPSEFDCKVDDDCPPEALESLDLDYLAKDYATFRRLMLDMMAQVRPDWEELNAADLESAIIETLAYAADRLSYFQDAAATEAYLGTARLRQSVRRHARLLDYFISEGCNARAWLCFETAPGMDGSALNAGTAIFAADIGEPATMALADFANQLPSTVVFETLHGFTLREALNEIPIYTWSDEECCLPTGATSCTLQNAPALNLAVGEVLVFEEIRHPETGDTANADRERRHAVRLTSVEETTDPVTGTAVVNIVWHSQDALPFAFRVSARVPSGGGTALVSIGVVRGNVVLADHGRTLTTAELDPELVPDGTPYRPLLNQRDLTFALPYDHDEARALPAMAVLGGEAKDARPRLQLANAQGSWTAQRDLLSSDRFALDFVAEVMENRSVQLRFGDDILGAKPREGSAFTLSMRYGSGRTGNVGADRLTCLVADQALVTRVWNPLPAVGGADPEPIADVKRDAPEAFRTQLRAVTEADWAARALAFSRFGEPAIQRAVAEFRWTGSWYTVFLTVDRTNGLPVRSDAAFVKDFLEYLNQYRIAGYDLELRDPVYVALVVRLFVCAKSGYFRSEVKQRILERLSTQTLADGTQGLFHPDRFSFGQSVYLSQLVAAVEAVDGVDSVQVSTFQRWGRAAAGELAQGFISIGPREVARLDNDPNFAENGVLEVTVEGGL